ncbi:GUN4 domain-containing protein [Cylindrospermum sp. NIES-4074]|nr:GUN4 domain-containing protein [Cylindrospermum sp. NIES-4074]
MSDVNYTQLEELLKAENWQAADVETLNIILRLAGRGGEGYLDVPSIKEIPCEELQSIDQLWVNYSAGRFGFTVQKRIWERAGGKSEVNDIVWTDFGWCVGWCNDQRKWLQYQDLTSITSPPVGHFPVSGRGGLESELFVARDVFAAIFSRLEECKNNN